MHGDYEFLLCSLRLSLRHMMTLDQSQSDNRYYRENNGDGPDLKAVGDEILESLVTIVPPEIG